MNETFLSYPCSLGPRFEALLRAFRLWPPILLLYAGIASAATIEVSADRNPVPLNESFTLLFSAEKTPDDDPDFTPLERDFNVLGQAKSSQIAIVNGHLSKRTEWQVTVMAKREGALTVPPIAFGSDRSAPLVLQAIGSAPSAPAGAGEDLVLEVEVEPKNPYVQAQAIYTVRVLSRIHFSGADLSEPSADNVLIQDLGKNREFRTQRNGLEYRAIERKYAIFPQKSGPLRLEPLTLEARVVMGGRSIFNSFFNQSTRILRVRSDPVELNVRPIPAAFSGKHWLPAERLEIEDSWSQNVPQTGAGEPITRTLTVRADGATVGLLPELAPQTSPPAGDIKRYPDQPLLNEEKLANGLASARQEKIALIPAHSGTYRLPPVEIPWWNTRTERMEVARLPERTLTVLPGADAPETAPPAPGPEPRAAAARPESPPPRDPQSAAGIWFWLALLFGLGWLGTAAAWWFSRNRRQAPAPVPRASDDSGAKRRAADALKTACLKNDAVGARQALLDWAGRRWPSVCPAGLNELERRCSGELGREIERLNRSLYRSPEADWQGQALWTAFRSYAATDDEAGEPAVAVGLEPLYKL